MDLQNHIPLTFSNNMETSYIDVNSTRGSIQDAHWNSWEAIHRKLSEIDLSKYSDYLPKKWDKLLTTL